MKLSIPILKREEEVGKIKDEETMQVYIEVSTWLPHQSVGDVGHSLAKSVEGNFSFI